MRDVLRDVTVRQDLEREQKRVTAGDENRTTRTGNSSGSVEARRLVYEFMRPVTTVVVPEAQRSDDAVPREAVSSTNYQRSPLEFVKVKNLLRP